MCSEKKCSAHFKAVLDYSWIIVDTTLLHQHKLYYCTITLICHVVKVNNKSCVIQGPDQDLAGTHQRLRDSMSSRAEVWFGSLTKQQQKNKPPSTGKRLMLTKQSLQSTSEF